MYGGVGAGAAGQGGDMIGGQANQPMDDGGAGVRAADEANYG